MDEKGREDPQPDRGQGPPDGKGRPEDHGRPVVGADLQVRYEAEVSTLHEQYPGAHPVAADTGLTVCAPRRVDPTPLGRAIFAMVAVSIARVALTTYPPVSLATRFAPRWAPGAQDFVRSPQLESRDVPGARLMF